MRKIAILYICTGKYSILWKEFYESFEKHFLCDCKKEYFVFTDADKLEYEYDNSKVHKITQEALEWPYSTLLRFHMFNGISDKLKTFDYIFFFNANAFAVNDITKEMILPREDQKEDICVVKHPAYRKHKVFEFPYDRNCRCKACIPYGFGKVYIQGCLIGGTTCGFLDMSKKIAEQIDIDLKKNIIALWHDESYLNKYTLKHKHFRLLGIEFADPVSDNPANVIIHMRPKNRYFNVNSVKTNAPATEIGKLNKFYNALVFGFLTKNRDFKLDYKNTKKYFGSLRAFLWGLKNFWKILL